MEMASSVDHPQASSCCCVALNSEFEGSLTTQHTQICDMSLHHLLERYEQETLWGVAEMRGMHGGN